MKRSVSLPVATSILIWSWLAIPSLVSAQVCDRSTSKGRIHLSAIPNGEQPSLEFTPMVLFDWYVVIDEVAPAFSAFAVAVDVPDEITFVTRAVLSDGIVFDFGVSPDDFVVGLDFCVERSQQPWAVVKYTGIVLDPEPVVTTARLEEYRSLGYPGGPWTPAWYNATLCPGGRVEETCFHDWDSELVISSMPVALDERSWGSLKARW